MKLPGVDLGINVAREVGEFKALLTSIVAKLDTLIEIEQAKIADHGPARWPGHPPVETIDQREGWQR